MVRALALVGLKMRHIDGGPIVQDAARLRPVLLPMQDDAALRGGGGHTEMARGGCRGEAAAAKLLPRLSRLPVGLQSLATCDSSRCQRSQPASAPPHLVDARILQHLAGPRKGRVADDAS